MTAVPFSAAASLAGLSLGGLASLRLAAQVMAHRAQLAGRPGVALYFDSLEASVLAEQAARAQTTRASELTTGRREENALPELLVSGARSADRRLIAEYLALLTANEQLPDEVRRLCRHLQARPVE
jgi:hypothetical protein